MSRIILILGIAGLSSHLANAQVLFEFNGQADLEVSKAGEQSHFYYNEIDKDNTDWRFGISQLTLISKITVDTAWSFNARFLLDRDRGRQLTRVSAPQLNLQWLSRSNKVGLTFGLFTNPFGSFNDKQLSTDRDFVGLPLAYSYYVNVSPRIGFLEGMGDINKVPVDGEVQWGASHLYYGGYSTGAMLSWNIKPSVVSWQVALVNGAPVKNEVFPRTLNWGLVSRLKIQPKYFWEQGFSVAYGSFMRDTEIGVDAVAPGDYSQALVGTDFVLGAGFLELSGEIIAALYQVPQLRSDTSLFVAETLDNPVSLGSYTGYLDFKYELPFLQGSYVAYRVDHLGFMSAEAAGNSGWDNNVWRHSVAAGYHIHRYLLARVAVSTQQVADKQWDQTQRTFRFVLTAHY